MNPSIEFMLLLKKKSPIAYFILNALVASTYPKCLTWEEKQDEFELKCARKYKKLPWSSEVIEMYQGYKSLKLGCAQANRQTFLSAIKASNYIEVNKEKMDCKDVKHFKFSEKFKVLYEEYHTHFPNPSTKPFISMETASTSFINFPEDYALLPSCQEVLPESSFYPTASVTDQYPPDYDPSEDLLQSTKKNAIQLENTGSNTESMDMNVQEHSLTLQVPDFSDEHFLFEDNNNSRSGAENCQSSLNTPDIPKQETSMNLSPWTYPSFGIQQKPYRSPTTLEGKRQHDSGQSSHLQVASVCSIRMETNHIQIVEKASVEEASTLPATGYKMLLLKDLL